LHRLHTPGIMDNPDDANAQPVAPKNNLNVVNGVDMFPGLRTHTGRSTYGADETREVIRLLNASDIPACVVDVNALRYYGAGRATWVC
jgi:hypothetical protein